MTDKKKNPRALALDSLIALERDGRYSNLEVNSALVSSSLSDADRGLYTRLVYGVTEKRITLDYIISQYSKKMPDELDPDVLTAIRLGIYQLVFMDRIPPHAAVGETAGLVSGSKTGYVNAVLRSFLRADQKYKLPKENDRLKYLSVKYSVPEDLVSLFLDSVGEGEIESLLDAMNREPHVALRVNLLKTTVEEALAKTGGRLSSIANDVILVDSLDDTAKEGIADGLWFVQDEASRIASSAVGARQGETVVDTCACPGGKSFSMAIDMKNIGKMHSFDLHKNKLSLITSGADRLGITIIETAKRDARDPAPDLIGKADRVLCDAPCSGLGVIAKKPDIRYKNLDDIVRLPEIQYAVLCGAAEYVKEGGVLVYSTCTINRAENESVVERFLCEHSDFSLDTKSLDGGMKTFYPHKDGCDGFFAAKLLRVNNKK
ncbi:MAG: 16S rRNA (cytosine(967)-C(5))-methyltransferase RsmB [Ruminococcaceae bacterium]|nr:16S rRNA (cytosine(967)-C(5))-methyltransferase RsmB [Oscillospiraceae bacterium]